MSGAVEQLYSAYKPLLVSLAYRMVGTLTDAEDLVQDAFLKVQLKGIPDSDLSKSLMCKVVTNASIDFLRANKRQRARYVGPWLPEPWIVDPNADPVEDVLRGDSLSTAYVVLLQVLNPTERAVFILREVFDYDYAEIATMLDKTEANARQLYSRAMRKVRGSETSHELGSMNPADLKQCIEAVQIGDVEALLHLLAPDATLYSDGGGRVTAATLPIRSGQAIAVFLIGVAKKSPPGLVTTVVSVGGQFGLLGRVHGAPYSIITFRMVNGKVQDIYMVLNPDKLRHLGH